MSTVRKHLSVANVLSCLALFVALSGATYAATTASKNSVKAKSIAKGAVTAPKLRNGAVTRPKIRNGAVIGTKIAVGAVGSNQLLDGGVRSVDLGGQVVTTAKLKDGAVTVAKLAPSLNGQLVRNVSYATAESASNNSEATKTATATCPTGKQVVGGGAKVIGGTILVAITASSPTPVNAEGKRNAWTAVAKEETGGGATNWSVETYAICAEF